LGAPGGIFNDPVLMCLNSWEAGIAVGVLALFSITDGVYRIRNGGVSRRGGATSSKERRESGARGGRVAAESEGREDSQKEQNAAPSAKQLS
jgi:hypothetical protein